MRSCCASCLVAVLLLHTLWPTLVLAQQPKAGVVTTLQGQAVVARPIIPQPVPLKFVATSFTGSLLQATNSGQVTICSPSC